MLIRNPARVRKHETRARAHVQRHVSWDTVAEQTEAVCAVMLSQS